MKISKKLRLVDAYLEAAQGQIQECDRHGPIPEHTAIRDQNLLKAIGHLKDCVEHMAVFLHQDDEEVG